MERGSGAETKSIYVHIPFCRSKCAYCDFLSIPVRDEQMLLQYLEALIQEMALFSGLEPRTLYIGGGTPSLLSPWQFEYLLLGMQRHFNLRGVEEFSLEANPDSVDEKRIEAWLGSGINRISLGVQSFDDTVLRAVDRKASESDVLHAVRLFHEAGVDNFGFDLILGLQPSYRRVDPGSASRLFRNDLQKAVSLQPTHISVYMLGIGDETALGRMTSGYDRYLLNDASLEEMYLFAVEFLTGHGYRQYELSNFSIPGKESLHNRHYWHGEDYIGLGLGAVSTVGRQRTRNSGNLQEYIAAVKAGRNPFEDVEMLDRNTLLTESIMLSLRMAEGLDMSLLMRDMPTACANQLESYCESLFEHGFAKKKGSRLMLTAAGYLRSNAIIADIVRVTEVVKNRHS